MIMYGRHLDVTTGPFKDRPAEYSRKASAQVRTGAPPGTRTPNPRIKSLSGARSPGFTGVRTATQTPRAHPGELGRTAVNCNPNCNPSPSPSGSPGDRPPRSKGRHGK